MALFPGDPLAREAVPASHDRIFPWFPLLTLCAKLPRLRLKRPQSDRHVVAQFRYRSATCTSGTLFCAPKRLPHGPHVAKTDVVRLTVFDDPLTVA
jgi:hypothetical protein